MESIVTNNVVHLLVGPRGAGKSEFVRKVANNNRQIHVVSRDEILTRICGTITPDSYSGGHQFCRYVMERLLRRKLSISSNINILFDCWTGSDGQRARIIEMLRNYGADKVNALFFTTPLEVVEDWFWRKPGIAKSSESHDKLNCSYYSENAPRNDYELFYETSQNIHEVGFDEIIYINPLQQEIIF